MKTNNLAYRIPLLAASLALLGGCYTMFRHPVTDVTADADHDTVTYGTDCGSCHAGGFEQALFPDPYPYVAAPFIGFYEPWRYPRGGWTPGGYTGTGSGESADTRAVGDDVRMVGSRGPATGRPNVYTPPSPGTSSPSTSPTPAASGSTSGSQSGSSSPPAAGPQPGRRMKDSLDSREPAPPKKQKTDEPKDGSGG